MDERVMRPEEMASTSTAVATTTIPSQLQEEELPVERVAVITLRRAEPRARKKVLWTEDTVDNEDMNKKKSKCCCIYEKPRKFGDDSDSDSSDDECEHCFGHVEKKHGKQHTHTVAASDAQGTEATVSLPLKPPAPPEPDKAGSGS